MPRQIDTFARDTVEGRTAMEEEQVPDNAEWLVRREEVDYGPFTTEEVLASISSKEITLGTLVGAYLVFCVLRR